MYYVDVNNRHVWLNTLLQELKMDVVGTGTGTGFSLDGALIRKKNYFVKHWDQRRLNMYVATVTQPSSFQLLCDIMHPCTQADVHSNVSVNSARWLPHVGQGVVYCTNRGDLHICRPLYAPPPPSLPSSAPPSPPNRAVPDDQARTEQFTSYYLIVYGNFIEYPVEMVTE